VFARAGGADREFWVEAVGQGDVHRPHQRVVGDLVEVRVVVDRRFRNPVLGGNLSRFLRRAADQRGGPGVLAMRKGRQHLLQRNMAQADDREADALTGWVARFRRGLRTLRPDVLERRKLNAIFGSEDWQRGAQ
jgi:hypothetical protein